MEKRAEKKSKQKGNETFYVLKDTKSRNKWKSLIKCRDAMTYLGKVNKTLLDFFSCYGFLKNILYISL